MPTTTYSALIRTFNSQATLPATLRSLAGQTLRPNEYVVVDSGSTDDTLKFLPSDSTVRRFVGPLFNYSEALNQGLEHVSTDYVLIISSHTELRNSQAIGAALRLLDSDPTIGAAYFCGDNSGQLRHTLIDENTFDGFNGLWNTCSLVRVPLLRRRPFRREVFTAEDQEWASWLFRAVHMRAARFSGSGMVCNNPRGASLRKRLNEYVAIAYFANRALLRWNNLARIGCGIISPNLSYPPRERFYNFLLLSRLLACKFAEPGAQSRYF